MIKTVYERKHHLGLTVSVGWSVTLVAWRQAAVALEQYIVRHNHEAEREKRPSWEWCGF